MVWSNAAEQSWVENQSKAEQSAHPKSKWMTSPVKHKFPILARVASEATAAVAQSVVAWAVWALAEPYALLPAGALDAEPVLARPPHRTEPGSCIARNDYDLGMSGGNVQRTLVRFTYMIPKFVFLTIVLARNGSVTARYNKLYELNRCLGP